MTRRLLAGDYFCNVAASCKHSLSDRARRASDPNAIVPPPIRRKDRPSKPNGLTKQTYSVTVNLPGSSETRKWHVVAYFSVCTDSSNGLGLYLTEVISLRAKTMLASR